MPKRERFVFAALIVAGVVIRAIAYFRYRFDSDEPQHLHVAWGWTAGLLQYRDLFDNHAPLFHMLSAPLLRLVGERSDVLLFMRAPMLLLFALFVWATYVIARRLYSPRVAAWSALLLALLPPFFLKSLEFRTDNLWNTFWIVALLILTGGAYRAPRAFVAGVVMGLAMGVSMKTALLVVTLAIAAIVTNVMKGRRDPSLRSGQAQAHPAAGTAAFLCGFVIVPATIVAYFASKHALGNLLYCNFTFNEGVALTRNAFAIWAPRIAYLPVMFVVLRFAWRGRDARRDRFFLAVATGTFFVTLFAFWLLISPRDFLPFLPMLVIFAVAAVEPRRWAVPLFVAAACLFVFDIARENQWFRNQTREEITMMDQVRGLTRPGEMIMDYKGETIYRQRPFYPILEFITRNEMIHGMIADTIARDIVAKRCYVAQADGVFFPPDGRAFMNDNFVDLGRLRAAGQWIKADGSFTIAIPGSYVILNSKGVASGTLDGTPFTGPRTLAPGSHFFARANSGQRTAVLWAPAWERGYSPFHLRDRDF